MNKLAVMCIGLLMICLLVSVQAQAKNDTGGATPKSSAVSQSFSTFNMVLALSAGLLGSILHGRH